MSAVLLFAAALAAAAPLRLEGTVRDAAGTPVANATVSIEAGRDSARVSTDAAGRFAVDWSGPRLVMVTVEATGFPRARRAAYAGDAPVDLVLASAAFQDRVTVTAARRPEALGDTAASVLVLSSSDLKTTAGMGLDDALRQVPGFTLFRRTPSRGANPTTQGATFRGLAGSGASRALVLEDGVPLNDPFGGWIYWGRVPRTAVERLEVLRGGASDLYGSSALAGVVQVVRAGSEVPRLEGEFTTGQEDLGEGSLFAGGRRGSWGARVAAEVFSTSGYRPIPDELRGPVDGRLSTRHHGGDVTLERAIGSGRAFVRASGYRESRGNGTALQDNDTSINQGVLGLDLPTGTGGLRFRFDLSRQDYNQTFSAVAADRKTERLTSAQHVPARSTGFSGQWTRPLGRHVLVLGAERRGIWGRSDEDSFATATTVRSTAGGRQRTTAFFVEDSWSLGRRLIAHGGVRLDLWRNYNGRQTSGAAVTPLADRDESAFSPRGSLLFKISRRLSLTASAYRAFRAPTLNELYRPFRVGNVLTIANAGLSAERATGREAGVLIGLGDAVSLRGTAFSMDATDTVANVTLTTTPSLITRQRRNLGEIRSRGVEADAEGRIGSRLVLAAGITFLDTRVLAAPDLALVGKRVPQVPRRQGGAQLRYDDAKGFTLGVQARFSASQYDDDLNSLRLGGYWTLDAVFGHSLNEWVGFFLAGENLRDVEYDVGRTPLRTVGPPRTIRGGFRVRLRGGARP
ncbi:MAG TPA: TonB-dependent receptor [Vicinamibacteria bacterium]|jgi:outer membrane receptor protein involved in Fe transport